MSTKTDVADEQNLQATQNARTADTTQHRRETGDAVEWETVEDGPETIRILQRKPGTGLWVEGHEYEVLGVIQDSIYDLRPLRLVELHRDGDVEIAYPISLQEAMDGNLPFCVRPYLEEPERWEEMLAAVGVLRVSLYWENQPESWQWPILTLQGRGVWSRDPRVDPQWFDVVDLDFDVADFVEGSPEYIKFAEYEHIEVFDRIAEIIPPELSCAQYVQVPQLIALANRDSGFDPAPEGLPELMWWDEVREERVPAGGDPLDRAYLSQWLKRLRLLDAGPRGGYVWGNQVKEPLVIS